MLTSSHPIFIWGGAAISGLGLYLKKPSLVIAGLAVTVYGLWMRSKAANTIPPRGRIGGEFAPPQTGSLNAGVPDDLNLGNWADRLRISLPQIGTTTFGNTGFSNPFGDSRYFK